MSDILEWKKRNEIARLKAEIARLKTKSAQAYQVIGSCMTAIGDDAFESADGQRALDYFSDETAFDENFLVWPRADFKGNAARLRAGFMACIRAGTECRHVPACRADEACICALNLELWCNRAVPEGGT